MSNVTADTAERTSGKTDQVKESVSGAVEQVSEQAQQARGQARQRLSQELSTRSTDAGKQVREATEALQEASRNLKQQGKDGPSNAIDRVAGQTEKLASYLTEANGDRMLRDIERFARKQPWAFTAGGIVLGFFASRFLKASSTKRYEGGDAMYRSDPTPAQYPALPAGTAGGGGSHVDVR